MKFTVSKKQLTAALKAVLPAVSSRPGIPILTGVRLETSADGLLVEATDLELSIRRRIPGSASDEDRGSVIVRGKLLATAVQAMPEDEIALESVPNQRPALHVTAGSRTVILQGFPPEEWPDTPATAASGVIARVEASTMADAFTRAALCASSDEARPILTGVALFFEEDSQTLEVVATDSYRMGAIRVPLAGEPMVPKGPPLVPARIAKALARQLKDAGGEVEILELEGDRIAFAFADTVWTVQTIDGEFPNWRQVMPEPEGALLQTDAAVLASALKAATSVRASKEASVRLTLDSECFVTLTEQDAGTLIEVLDGARFSPDGIGALEVSFNPEYLLDGVRFTGEERARMWVRDGLKPALLEAPDRRYAVMPIRKP